MYTVIEFWAENANSDIQIMSYPKNNKDEAMSTYHYVLYMAAVSSHYVHGAIVIDIQGRYLARESFTHTIEPSDEPVVE